MYTIPLHDNGPGKRAEGDVPGVQQGRRGLHLRGGAQVRHDPPAGQGDGDGDGDGVLSRPPDDLCHLDLGLCDTRKRHGTAM